MELGAYKGLEVQVGHRAACRGDNIEACGNDSEACHKCVNTEINYSALTRSLVQTTANHSQGSLLEFYSSARISRTTSKKKVQKKARQKIQHFTIVRYAPQNTSIESKRKIAKK